MGNEIGGSQIGLVNLHCKTECPEDCIKGNWLYHGGKTWVNDGSIKITREWDQGRLMS